MQLKVNNRLYRIHDPLYKNTIILLANSASTAVLGFVYWMVVARIYSPVDVGYGSAAISALTLLGSLGLLGVNNTLIRFLPSFGKPKEMINTAITLTAIISLVITIVFVSGIDFFSPALIFIKTNIIFAAAFVVFAVSYCVTSVLDGTFISHRKTQYVFILDTSISILKIPLAVVFGLSFHSFGIAASWGLATAVMVIISVLLFVPRVQQGYKPIPAIKLDIVEKIWQYSSTNYIASIIANLPAWLLPIIIVNLLGSEKNAYFYVAWLIYTLLMAIPYATSNSLFAEASHNISDIWKIVRKTLRFSYLLLIPAVIFIIVLGPKILWLFGENYSSESSSLLMILAASVLFGCVYCIYGVILRVLNRMKELCIMSAIHSLLILAACLIFIRHNGLISIGYIWFCVQVISCGYVAISIWRKLKTTSTGQN